MTTAQILEHCRKLKAQKKSMSQFLADQGVSSAKAKQIKQQLKTSAPVEEKARTKVSSDDTQPEVKITRDEEKKWATGLKFTKRYTYNKGDDKYIMYLRTAGYNVVIPGQAVRDLASGYSNWVKKPNTINEMCRSLEIPRNYLTEILSILGITHDSEPLTREALEEAEDLVEVVGDLLQQKRFKLHQEFEQQDWRRTIAQAEKWDKFMEGTFNPFTDFLSRWTPPKYERVQMQAPLHRYVEDKAMVVGLSDVHYGAKASAKNSFRGKGYSTKDAVEAVDNYFLEIKHRVSTRGYGINKCVVAAMGDILHSQGAGFTVKGTMLTHDCLKEEQFQAAFDSISKFLKNLLTIFPTVEVKSVKGNHNDFGDWVLFKTLEALFSNEPRISFEVFQTDHGLFKVGNTLFVISHGYSAEYKGRLPSAGSGREAYIGNLFLSHPEQLIGVKHKVLLTADQHHLEMKEYAEFEHYMLSTAIKGDQHSEAMGLNNKARQSAFVVGNDGIEEIVYCYSK